MSTQGVERLESFLESISGEEALIDIDAMIQGFDLGGLVDRYASGSFRPIPERTSIFNLEVFDAKPAEESG